MLKKHIIFNCLGSLAIVFIMILNLPGCTNKSQWVHYSPESPRTIRAIIEDSNHNFWVATSSSGQLYYYDTSLKSWTLQPIPDGLGKVQTLMASSEDDIWIGTSVGLTKYQPNGNGWKVYSANDGLMNNDIRVILQDNNNAIWVGVGDGGLYRSLNDGESWDPVTDFIGVTIYDIYQDSSNNIWVSSGNLLSQYNYETRKWINYHGDNSEPRLLVTDITEAPDGSIWFATLGGVYKYNPIQISWEKFTTLDGLSDNEVWAVKLDPQGNLWFGTKAGATIFNSTENKWVSVTKKNGFTNFTVSIIFIDSMGQVWLGTLGDGLYRYNSNQ